MLFFVKFFTIFVQKAFSIFIPGFQDSHLRVWSLTPRSLRSVKSANELSMLDKESDDVFERMMSDYTGSESKCVTLS